MHSKHDLQCIHHPGEYFSNVPLCDLCLRQLRLYPELLEVLHTAYDAIGEAGVKGAIVGDGTIRVKLRTMIEKAEKGV